MKPIKKILFPVKAFTKDNPQTSEDDDQRKDSRNHSHVKLSNIAPTEKLIWKGITPLEMMERIASMIEPDSVKEPVKSLRIDPAFLASKTPDLPLLPPCWRHGFAVDERTNLKMNKSLSDTTVNVKNESIIEICPVPLDPKNHKTIDVFPGHKRNRGSSDMNDEYSLIKDEYNLMKDEDSINKFSQENITPWDPSYLISYDPNPCAAKTAVDQLSLLALKLESSQNYADCWQSYARFRDKLAIDSEIIFHEPRKLDEQKRQALETLYNISIIKMKALLSMAENMQQEESCSTFNTLSQVNFPEIFGSGSVDVLTVAGPYASTQLISDKIEFSKKHFANYMNNWLRENWTNPYPDDDGLLSIANHCGTNSTVVSNWLINARTRKWRPAIVKAFHKGRPSELLKEDAINIFDGIPLREIPRIEVVGPPIIYNWKR